MDTAYEISHPEATFRHHVLCDVSCNNGKIFITTRDKDTVSVSQIINHKPHEIRKLTFPEKEIFRARFTAETRSTFVITKDACCYLDHLNKTEELPMSASKTCWDDICIAPSGERYYLNSN